MRTLPSGILAGLSAETVRVIYLVRLDFDTQSIGWNTGFRDISFGGITYGALGNLTSMSAPKEEPGVKSSSVTLGVSGIGEEVVSLLLGEPYLGRTAYIHYTLLDQDDVSFTDAPVLLFRGSMDSIEGELGSKANFTVTVKSRLADWERPRVSRYTDAEQQKLYPGDKGFQFVGQMAQRQIIWPRAAFLADPRD